ncbi:MAG TPA: dihydrolipoyl dehydrogenase [Syntrophomonadaceae bacterium]|nr:dihydrolipoyl dehydrogenase [Syntrophomonadaceae bacterium]
MKDLLIIGGGPGGYVAAIRAAQLGMDVTLVEKDSLGGTCLNRGCIPTKAYFQNAQALKNIQKSEQFNITVEDIQFSLKGAKERKDNIVNKLVNGISQLLKTNRVEVIEGSASFVDKNTVNVNGKDIKAKNIIIATGSEPAELPIEGISSDKVLTSDTILDIIEVPKKLTIIGGGVIGLEFACIFNTFGSEVTVIEYMPSILNMLDAEIAKRMNVFLKRQGITVYTSTSVEKIIETETGLNIIIEGKKGLAEISADLLLAAGGRRASVEGLDINNIGILTEKGFIQVNENLTTNIDNIYAIGDVIGGQMLAHVASEEGIAVVEQIAGLNSSKPYYYAVPSCIFTFPEIATVGLSEEEVKASSNNYKVGKFQFAANGKAMTMGETDGLVKVIADENDVIVGMHIIGPHASDLILEGIVLVKNKMSIKDTVGIIHPHPTLGEAIAEAIMDLNKQAIHLAPKKK